MQLQQQLVESEQQIFQLDDGLKQQLNAYVQSSKSVDEIAYSLYSQMVITHYLINLPALKLRHKAIKI